MLQDPPSPKQAERGAAASIGAAPPARSPGLAIPSPAGALLHLSPMPLAAGLESRSAARAVPLNSPAVLAVALDRELVGSFSTAGESPALVAARDTGGLHS